MIDISNVILSIIIVNYKTPWLLVDCIESITKETKNLKYEVIVIDNNSQDNSKQIVTGKYQFVKWVQMGYNSGFAKANNLGMKIADGKFILLLNSDTIIIDNAIEKSINYLKKNKNSKIGCVSCKLLNSDLSVQYNAFPDFKHFTIDKAINANPIAIYFTRNKNKKAIYERKIEEFHKFNQKVAWLSGAFMLFPSNVIKKNKLEFNEDYFMYAEDFELCFQLHKLKYELHYFSGANIIHLGGKSSVSDERKNKQIIYSQMLCIKNCFGIFRFFINQLVWFVNFSLDYILFFKNRILNRNNVSKVNINSLKLNEFVKFTIEILFK